jgi:type II secretory pathway component GspD/PulD (secretin)
MINNLKLLTSNFKSKNQIVNNKLLIILVLIFTFEISCLKVDIASAVSPLISSIDFVDAPVVGVVQTLARSAGCDLVLAGDQAAAQAKKATIRLRDITIDEAIDNILRTNGFSYERNGNILLVSALPQDLSATAYKQEIEVARLKHLSANKAAELLTKLLPGSAFQVGGRANALVMRGKRSELADAKTLLDSIDQLAPQILIESKVMELTQSDSQKLGISYGNGSYRFITNRETKRTRPEGDLVSTLNALAADGRANVVANPRIATLDNQEALINIGSRIPYAVPVTSGGTTTQWTVNYIDAGVKLKITPQLGQDGEITTLIQPEVSSISEWRTTAAGDFPVISTRNAAATVRVRDGETIVIGGLLSETERQNTTRVPVLGYIPGIGLLFQNKSSEKEKTEIVFLITPHVI